jgi:hypothetical protein
MPDERSIAVDLSWAQNPRFPEAIGLVTERLLARGWTFAGREGEIRTFTRADGAEYGEEIVRAQCIVGQWFVYDPTE